MAYAPTSFTSFLSLLTAAALCGSGCAKRYRIQGLVLETDAAQSTVTISHKEIPGLMPAMAMPFRLTDPKVIPTLSPGMMVEFELRGSTARNIRPLPPSNQIEEDGRKVALAPPASQVKSGEVVPDFALTSHTGQRTRLTDFRDQVVAINFLYTRCPLPEVCPRLAATFARIQRRFAHRNDLTLLTITLDPHHDTVEVLNRYSILWKADSTRWRFLTGAPDDIRRAAELFGIIYWPEEGIVTHTSSIAIIGKSGKLHARIDGLSFDAKQLGDLIESALSY